MSHFTRVVLSGVLVLLGIGVTTSLAAQQRWQHQVEDRLGRAIAALRTSSRDSSVRRTGMLNTDETASFQTALVQGTSYAIVAVCDDDCSRLSLTLVSPSGSELAKDRDSESFPTLHFNAPQSITYGVRVVMEGCRWNPCWYGVTVVPLGVASLDAPRITP